MIQYAGIKKKKKMCLFIFKMDATKLIDISKLAIGLQHAVVN